MLFKDWQRTYQPRINPFGNHPTSPTRGGDVAYFGCLISVTGKEFNWLWEYAKRHPDHIWTLVKPDGIETIVTGKRFAYAVGYFVTEKPFSKNIQVFTF